MSKANQLRDLGYSLSLLPGDEIDIQLPEGQQLTERLQRRLKEIKPILLADLKAESSDLFQYIGYRTRKDQRGHGRLEIEFVSRRTDETVKAYFNIEITYQRGVNKGHDYRTGRNGRFWPKPYSKFSKFWEQTFGTPERWSTVYRQMSKMKSFCFTGNVQAMPTYRQIVDLKKA
jgi:uncharacterized C2H2 Zn-finger protein